MTTGYISTKKATWGRAHRITTSRTRTISSTWLTSVSRLKARAMPSTRRATHFRSLISNATSTNTTQSQVLVSMITYCPGCEISLLTLFWACATRWTLINERMFLSFLVSTSCWTRTSAYGWLSATLTRTWARHASIWRPCYPRWWMTCLKLCSTLCSVQRQCQTRDAKTGFNSSTESPSLR